MNERERERDVFGHHGLLVQRKNCLLNLWIFALFIPFSSLHLFFDGSNTNLILNRELTNLGFNAKSAGSTLSHSTDLRRHERERERERERDELSNESLLIR